MKKEWLGKQHLRVRYELKKEHEEKYIGYLTKRYGMDRVNNFKQTSM